MYKELLKNYEDKKKEVKHDMPKKVEILIIFCGHLYVFLIRNFWVSLYLFSKFKKREIFEPLKR